MEGVEEGVEGAGDSVFHFLRRWIRAGIDVNVGEVIVRCPRLVEFANDVFFKGSGGQFLDFSEIAFAADGVQEAASCCEGSGGKGVGEFSEGSSAVDRGEGGFSLVSDLGQVVEGVKPLMCQTAGTGGFCQVDDCLAGLGG